jgi:hypothetical protein
MIPSISDWFLTALDVMKRGFSTERKDYVLRWPQCDIDHAYPVGQRLLTCSSPSNCSIKGITGITDIKDISHTNTHITDISHIKHEWVMKLVVNFWLYDKKLLYYKSNHSKFYLKYLWFFGTRNEEEKIRL